MTASTTPIDRDAELERLARVLDRGCPLLQAWEVGLLCGSEASTRAKLAAASKNVTDLPAPAVVGRRPKWAPGAIAAFLAGEWRAPQPVTEITSIRSGSQTATRRVS